MRIADQTRLGSVMRDLSSIQRQLFLASREASSGSRLAAPSSDPIAAAQMVRVQAADAEAVGYRNALRTIRGDVELAESTLDDAANLADSLRELAMRGANGSLSAEERTSLAAEVRHLKSELVARANQKGSIGYLFGGTLDQSPAFSASGVWLGNAMDRVAAIAPGQTMVSSVSGALAFTSLGGIDVFASVEALAIALETNNQPAVASSVNTMDTARRQILAARVDAGVKLQRIDTADQAHSFAQLSLSSQAHTLGDADPAASYSRLTSLQTTLQQSISVARSLLDTLSVQRF